MVKEGEVGANELVLDAEVGPATPLLIPVPSVVPGDVLVKIEATSLNPVDWKLWWTGLFAKDFPIVLSTAAVGIVEDVGEGVTNFVKGDRV